MTNKQRIRSKKQPISPLQQNKGSLNFGQMTRQQALNQIKRLLKQSPASISARQLIGLFNIQAEELSEVGVSYEILKGLSQTCHLA